MGALRAPSTSALATGRSRLAGAQVGFRVWGLGFGVWGLGFGVWGLGFGVWGLGFRVQGSGLRILFVDAGFRGFGLMRPLGGSGVDES